MWFPYIAAGLGGALSGLLLYAWQRGRIPYPIDPAAPWGPFWGAKRPPGLPPTTRQASAVGGAEPFVRAEAGKRGLGGAFVEAVLGLAQNESRLTYGRPANTFDARCGGTTGAGSVCTTIDGRRPSDSALITSWGVFQFKRDTWWAVAGREEFPWEASAHDEIAIPINRYEELWRRAKRGGADDLSATRVIRLWHRSPGEAEAFLAEGSSSGAWQSAWLDVDPRHQAVLDEKLG